MVQIEGADVAASSACFLPSSSDELRERERDRRRSARSRRGSGKLFAEKKGRINNVPSFGERSHSRWSHASFSTLEQIKEKQQISPASSTKSLFSPSRSSGGELSSRRPFNRQPCGGPPHFQRPRWREQGPAIRLQHTSTGEKLSQQQQKRE